jgi:superfamily II DNA or RNA helicase
MLKGSATAQKPKAFSMIGEAPKLRSYQVQGVHAIRAAFKAGRRGVLYVLPTGGGKTHVLTDIAVRAAQKGRRVLHVVHRRELTLQISAALERRDLPHGLIAPGQPTGTQPVQVAMAQTLARRLPLDRTGRFRFDLVIVDEAHHATRDSIWGAILQHNNILAPGGARLLGVTATPCRLDGKGLGAAAGGFFDELVVGPSVAELIELGYLARPVVYAPDRAVDLSGVKQRGGDYVAGQLAARMDQAALTGDAVAHYQRYCGGAPAIAFTVTVEHAAHVAEDFARAGYQAAVLTGATPDRSRAAMIRDLGSGALHVLASCNVVSEGTDIPAVQAAILLRPTASYALAMQQMGRALRAAPGKTCAVLLDHAGNSLRHGLPTEPVEWSLEGVRRAGEAGRGERPPSAPAAEAREFDVPWVRAGDLSELTPEKRAALQRWRREAERQARSLEDFRAIGEACGYKPGWARYRFSELRR